MEKEESVYVTLDANGGTQDIVVSDWLKNSGVGTTLKDQSDLSEIQNTKGDEAFTQDGEELSWEAGEQDIYYQGKVIRSFRSAWKSPISWMDRK